MTDQMLATLRPVEKWEKIIKDWEKSGLSRNAYCKKYNIPDSSFYKWHRKINTPKLLNKAKTLKLTRTQYTAEQWQEIIKDWEQSGLSKSEYCKENDITETVFYTWSKKLENSDFTNKPRAQKFLTFRSLEQWQEIIEDCEKSGLSRAAYGRKTNISPRLLLAWSRKLKNPEFVKKRKRRERLQSRFTPEQWMEFLKDWEKSGLSKAAYCLKTGVSEHGLYAWARKLKTLEPAPQPEQYTEVQESPSISSFEEHFIPVTIKPSPFITQSGSAPKIDVTLSQGHRLSIQGPFHWEGLVPLLTSILRI